MQNRLRRSPPAATDGRGAAEAGQSTPSATTATIAQYSAAAGVAGMDALLTGNVQNAGRCVYVAEGEGQRLPVFPKGSVVWQANGTAFRYNGRLYADGDEISLGGGAASGGAELAKTFFSTPLPRECETYEMWIVSP